MNDYSDITCPHCRRRAQLMDSSMKLIRKLAVTLWLVTVVAIFQLLLVAVVRLSIN